MNKGLGLGRPVLLVEETGEPRKQTPTCSILRVLDTLILFLII